MLITNQLLSVAPSGIKPIKSTVSLDRTLSYGVRILSPTFLSFTRPPKYCFGKDLSVSKRDNNSHSPLDEVFPSHPGPRPPLTPRRETPVYVSSGYGRSEVSRFERLPLTNSVLWGVGVVSLSSATKTT